MFFSNHMCPSLCHHLTHVRRLPHQVPAVVDIRTLKGRFIDHKFSRGWSVGVVKSVETKRSVADQFAVKYKSEKYYWTQN